MVCKNEWCGFIPSIHINMTTFKVDSSGNDFNHSQIHMETNLQFHYIIIVSWRQSGKTAYARSNKSTFNDESINMYKLYFWIVICGISHEFNRT